MVSGSLFDSTAKYIAHQCNCVTNKAAHLSADVFSRYPYADVYCTRVKEQNWRNCRDKPGTIDIKGDGLENRFVINMFGQIFPGKPKFPESNIDGYEARRFYFNNCLIAISKIKDLESVAFPYGVGCGAAGGDWSFYQKLIDTFSKFVNAETFIYKLEQ